MVYARRIIILFVLVEVSRAAIFNGSFLEELDNDLSPSKSKKHLSGRRQFRRKDRSTSSSSREKQVGKGDKSKVGSSLDLSEEDSSSSNAAAIDKATKKSYTPKSSVERKGWKKWHRKCTQCPEEMHLKWRDPSIKWICGAYQRARRSFKSLCMMHYRNCQDGTMFTKIADHRCQNDTDDKKHGDHFFYDYKVKLSVDTSSTKEKSSSSSGSKSSETKTTSSESWDSDKIEEHKKKNHINVNGPT